MLSILDIKQVNLFIFITFFFINQVFAFRFVVYGDSRSSTINPPFNSAVLGYINSQITSLNPEVDFVIFTGDSVRRAKSAGHSYLHDWHEFMINTLKEIPLYVVVGNSDIYGDTGWTEYDRQVEFQAEFSDMPSNAPSDSYKYLTYSFEYGEGSSRSIFVVLDAFYVTPDNVIHYDNNIDNTQINWFNQQSSSATHKFLLSHGPFFSPEGWPVGNGIRQIWNNAQNYDLVFCSHEHIYSRWNLFPDTLTSGPQILTGTCGAPIDPNDNSHYVNPKAHPYYGYNFSVIDVDGDNVILHTYSVTDQGEGNFSTALLDTVRLSK